ncbi:MAG: sigma-70 family RNA polymerase sigma factor [Planctomycetia bacterium]|nr:sigma-70 family RNA polymerase sigma factor [Planctomycetia bacterium]
MIPPHPPDAELVVRTAAGDRGAFEALYARYAPRIMAFIDHLLADRGAAEDATQETFVKVWRSARRFRPEAPFEPWLFRIARHEAYDAARRRRPRPLSALAPAAEEAARAGEAPGSGARDREARSAAVDDVMRGDGALAATLRTAIAALSAPLREAFVLARVLGRAHDEVAMLLGIPVGTVKSRLSAAEAELRRRLAAWAPDAGDATGGAP